MAFKATPGNWDSLKETPKESYDSKKDYSKEIKEKEQQLEKAKTQKEKDALEAQIEEAERKRAAKIADASAQQLKEWNINRAGQDLKTLKDQPYGTPKLNEAETETLMKQNNNKNDVTVIDENGKEVKMTGYILSGHTYIPIKDASGNVVGAQRLLNYDQPGSGGMYDGNALWDPTDHTANGIKYDGSAYLKLPGKVSTTEPQNQSYTRERPERPEREKNQPAYLYYTDPMPTFTSNVQTVNKFSYFFGVDKLELKNISINKNCCFISKDIYIGDLKENDYLELEASSWVNDSSNVEFYILDGNTQIPICPVNEDMIENEKIFTGLKPRFQIDNSYPIVIKKDGNPINMTLDKAMESTDGLYTITYKPLNGKTYKPLNNNIKIKIVLRLYKSNEPAPAVGKLKIRKFGGDNLWA